MATKVEYSSDEGSDADQLANGKVGQRQSARLKCCPGCKTSLGGKDHIFGPPSKDCEGPEHQPQPSLVHDALKSEYELGPDPCGEEMLLMEKFRELEEQERRLRLVHLIWWGLEEIKFSLPHLSVATFWSLPLKTGLFLFIYFYI